jgi:putative ABC transport system substrate-binding protein
LVVGATACRLLLGLAVALTPTLAEAQATSKSHRIGLLMQTTPAAASHIARAFSQELGELGHVEGKNLLLEYRWAEGKPDRFPALAAELVRLKVDLIIASALPAAEAARQATTTIPIVMVNVADPIEVGLVGSLARPGGNVTGLSAVLTPEIRAKQLQLLKEALPGLARLAILRRAVVAPAAVWKDYEVAGRALELKVRFVDVQGDDFDRAFAAITRERAGAVLVPGDAIFFAQRQRLVALAAEHRLPGMFSTREFTDAGGLMSYSARLTDLFRRAAVYADKILKGASPATLPVESPTEFELVINLRTAKALKLAIPQPFLIRADQVIQ